MCFLRNSIKSFGVSLVLKLPSPILFVSGYEVFTVLFFRFSSFVSSVGYSWAWVRGVNFVL